MWTKKSIYLSIILWALALGGCGSESTDNPTATVQYDFTLILQDSTEQVIIPTYSDLKDRSSELFSAVQKLEQETSESNLTTAKEAWVTTRVPWEQSEAFLFGPVSDENLDPSLDSWPVDRTQLDQVLASGLELSADSISENQGGGLKGFHTIEYLLWGTDNKKTATDLADKTRELEYLVAVTEALKNDAARLHEAWAGQDGFGQQFYLAGQQGGRYYSQADAFQQLVNGIVDISDEVANGKIADPFDEQDVTLVESQFSYNSIQDFTDNLRSAQNIYTGQYDGQNAAGLHSFVAEKDPVLDQRIRNEIQAGIDAIYAISADGQPFRDAVTDPNKKALIEAAQEAVRTVMDTFGGDVLSLLRS